MSTSRLRTHVRITWCPGCGNFVIMRAFTRAIVELGLKVKDIVVVTGIGCHGRLHEYLRLNSFHTIHGRVLPLAMGIKLANKNLIVVGFSGDGDAYSIGLSHFIHAARRNIDVKYIVHDNMVFGLTKGQASPTSPLGLRTKSTPKGNILKPINPIALALIAGATFVARGFTGDMEHLVNVFKQALLHRGFAFIDILQHCVTFYNVLPELKNRVYRLEDRQHNPSNFSEAVDRALELPNQIPIGVFYKVRRPTFEEQIPQLKGKPMNLRDVNIDKILKLLETYA